MRSTLPYAWVSRVLALLLPSLGVKALDSFCKTLDHWLEKIANYFVARASNGRLEGFNTGVRSILRRAFGMLNFEHLRLRVLDRFGVPSSS